METIITDGDYSIIKHDDVFQIYWKNHQLATPNGNPVECDDPTIASKIIEDINAYGEDSYTDPSSILSFHYTWTDFFSNMTTNDIIRMLNGLNWHRELFLQPCPSPSPEICMSWKSIFGGKERATNIQQWLSQCSQKQLTAVTCIYNTTMSMNLAYVMAAIVEHVNPDDQEGPILEVASLFCQYVPFFTQDDIVRMFINFQLFYCIDCTSE